MSTRPCVSLTRFFFAACAFFYRVLNLKTVQMFSARVRNVAVTVPIVTPTLKHAELLLFLSSSG